MPIIYMRHPRHGVKIATMELEAQYDEQSGWERYTPGQESEPEQTVNQMPRRVRRKEPEHADHGG
jgi:hypothetical protein